MMSASGAWETVGKSSKKSSSKHSNGNAKKGGGKNGGHSNTPRAEDVLPLKQVNSWYANAYDTPPSESEDEQVKKAPKKTSGQDEQRQSKNTKKNPPPKKEAPKKPSNIVDAASLIHASELKAFLNDFKVGYPNLKELWVRELALYLNESLETLEKAPEFLSDPFSDQPASALYRETKKIITSTLEECSGSERQSIFDIHLANVAHYMAKGKSVNGYLTIIQMLLEAFPTLCCGNTPKFLELRNSYQNQPHICLVLLWAVGQAGKHDLKSGLKVWLELMMPLMPLRHYHKFIVNYLSILLQKHQMPDRRLIVPPQFMQFLQVFFVHGPASLNKEMMESLMKNYSTIKALAIGNGSYDYELFPHLMRRLAAPESQTNMEEKTEILSILQQCVINSHEPSLSQWHQMYSSYVPQSAMLLESMVGNWTNLPKKIKRSKEFKRTLEAFHNYNSTNGNKDGILKSDSSCSILLSKMSSNESQGWFPWKTASFALILFIVALVQSDCQKHKTLKASNTGRLLSDIGLYAPLNNAYEVSSSSIKEGMRWMEEKSPEGMQMVRDGTAVLSSKIQTGAKVINEYAGQGYNIASDYTKEHAPILKAKAQYWIGEFISSAQLAMDWLKENAPHAKDKILATANHSFATAKKICNDVIEGKIDLADVKNYAVEKFNDCANVCAEAYKHVVDSVNKYTKK